MSIGEINRASSGDADREVRILRRNDGDIVRVLGDLYVTKGRAVDTEGRYSFFEARHEPGGGVPLHYHSHDEESFYVIDGTYEFQAGDTKVVAEAGDYLFVPRPTAHAFFNIGDRPGKVIIVLSPGGIHERFFAEVGEPIADPDHPSPPTEPDLPLFAAALARAGIVMLDEAPAPTQ